MILKNCALIPEPSGGTSYRSGDIEPEDGKMLYSEIKSWLEANKENIISDTLEVLKIHSESYNRPEVSKSLEQVLSIAQKLGFETELRAKDEVGVVFLAKAVKPWESLLMWM